MCVQIKLLTDRAVVPRYQSEHAAGMDLHAAIAEPITINPGEIQLIPCGFQMAVAEGFEAQVRPRSGLALRHGLTVANAPGTIDSDYRGEIGVVMVNLGDAPVTLRRGGRRDRADSVHR